MYGPSPPYGARWIPSNSARFVSLMSKVQIAASPSAQQNIKTFPTPHTLLPHPFLPLTAKENRSKISPRSTKHLPTVREFANAPPGVSGHFFARANLPRVPRACMCVPLFTRGGAVAGTASHPLFPVPRFSTGFSCFLETYPTAGRSVVVVVVLCLALATHTHA